MQNAEIVDFSEHNSYFIFRDFLPPNFSISTISLIDDLVLH